MEEGYNSEVEAIRLKEYPHMGNGVCTSQNEHIFQGLTLSSRSVPRS